MQKVLTAAEMREVDRLTTEKYGIPSIVLMENAAHAAFRIIKEILGDSVSGKTILILCGKGNNGGDGAALARILWTQGASVKTYLFGQIEETKGDAEINIRSLQKIVIAGESRDERLYFDAIHYDYWNHTTGSELQKFDLIIDALFGTGLTRPLGREFEVTLESLANKNDAIYVSLDLPSGLNSDSGDIIGYNIKANHTVTFSAPKLANVLPPAARSNGELHVVNIGSPRELIDACSSQVFLAEKSDVQNWLKHANFSDDSYKNKRGNVLLVVGSKRYSGAAALAGNAAIRTGAGLVTVATSESALEAVSTRVLPEVMTKGLPEIENGAIGIEAFETIEKMNGKADVLAIGCGLDSEEESTRIFVRKVVESRASPVVVDADALNSVSPFDITGSDEFPLILTPHEGEFLRLLGTSDRNVIRDRLKAVREFAEGNNVVLVLKGERTLVAAPDGRIVINPTGNSGLGKAGNGDNLTGIIAGFVAQAVQAQVDIFETVVAAVYTAGLSGDIAEKKFGKRVMLAGDVRDCMIEAFREIESNE